MKLTRLFAYSIALLSVLFTAMLGRILWDEWNKFGAARAGVHALQLAQHAMVAAEKLSYERGPVNGVLGDASQPPDPAKRQRLLLARADADRALATLEHAIAASRPAEPPAALATLARTRIALAAARTAVDRLAAQPPAQRTPVQLTATVEQMFGLIPLVMTTVTAFTRESEQRYPQLGKVLMNAYLAVELREYAGRIGSRLTTALSARQPLSATEQAQIEILRGRIAQLHQLLTLDAALADPRVKAAVQQMESLYFARGLDMIGAVESASRAGRPYAVDTAQFAQAYVPTMAPILTVRDTLLQAALDQAQQAYLAAQRQLLLACLTGALVVLVLALLLLIVQRRVVRPLLWATRALVELGNGELSAEVRGSTRQDEIGGLLRALAQLRAGSIEKQRLEAERQRLIDELRRSADTDYLTGILNRRAFTAAGAARVADARAQSLSLAVILLDIDHFKTINDRYGHEAGDQVLMQIAALLRQELRNGEILARYGGEEFIVMPACCDLPAAQAVAERLRALLEATPLQLPDGRVLRVTASFGVAAASGIHSTIDHLFHCADEALYRAKGLGRNRVAA